MGRGQQAMSPLRTLIRGIAPRVGSFRWQPPPSQAFTGLPHSGDLPIDNRQRDRIRDRERDREVAALQPVVVLGQWTRGLKSRAGPSLASDEASPSSLPLAPRSGTEPAQHLARAPARALHVSAPREMASERSPSGQWPSAPVGFERDWPPRGGTPVVIAMGGNVGDRVGNFRMGLRLLHQAGIVVERHACLYETAPAYLSEQPHFLNSAVQARTVLPPHDLLGVLKSIEKYVGRDFGTVRNGPRPLDLDIIFYGAQEVRSETLQVPHPRVQERPFVLAPLLDLLGAGAEGEGHWGRHPVFGGDIRRFWEEQGGEALMHKEDMRRVMPLQGLAEGASSGVGLETRGSPAGAHRPSDSLGRGGTGELGEGGAGGARLAMEGGLFWSKAAPHAARAAAHGASQRLLELGGGSQAPLVMGILNVTPDSFSDGGSFLGPAQAVSHALQMVADGADVIDVGGQSTRPGADAVSTQEELERVIPVIEALAAHPGMRGVTVSIDTFDSVVAAAAVAAGASVVNDVSGGTLDPSMFHTVARLEVPYILMHLRGDPKTMSRPPHTEYQSLVADVAAELAARAGEAEAAGIPSWHLMLDPGLGFAKTAEQSLQLIRELPSLRGELGRHQVSLRHAPLVLGPSRKKFLSRIAPRAGEASDRDWASCAVAAACVAKGADVVRMHNVRAGRDAADAAAAIWRP